MNEWEESERGSPSIISSHNHHSSSFVGRLRRKIFSRKGDTSVPDVDGLKKKCDSARRMQQHVIGVEDIAICKELGKGEFGSVYQAAWQNGDEVKQVAVKQIPPERLLANPVCFLQEAAIMTRMCHENVIRLHGVVLDTRSIMLVSELALGSLLEHLQRAGPGEPFPIDVLCDFAIQIAKGMYYLESQRLIHRDLAARNVLLCSPTTVKISDFGLSRSLGVGEDYYRSEFSPSMKLPIAWCAPESINYLRFTAESDVWAFGVTMWEMFTYGKMPWSGCSGAEILNSIDIERKALHRPESCPSDVYKLMCQCWSYEPECRPTFAELHNRLLPAVMPQLLLTINSVVYPKVKGNLAYDRDEILVLLDKCPTRVNGHWLGAIRRTGEVGLFEPRDTVAHLEAEKPSSSHLPPVDASSHSSESANGVEKLSGLSREQKKLLITEPRCDLKHVCHVGTDGSGFGLLNIDKSMLAKSVSPTTISSDCFTVRSLSPHPPPTPTPAASTSARQREIPTTTTPIEQPINRHQPDNSVPARPPKPGPRHTTSVRNHFRPQLITTFNMDMDPPQLPPKPHRRSRVKTPRLNSFPVDVGDIAEGVAEESDEYLNPEPTPPSSLNGISLLGSGPSMPNDSTCDESSKPVDSAAELDMVFGDLRRDIDEFTLNSQCSDSRPLLDSGAKERRNIWRNGCSCIPIPSAAHDGEKHQSLIRSMTQEERDKWERRVLSEHKSVHRSLEKEAASLANLVASHEVNKHEEVELAEAMESPRRQIIGFAARLPKILPRSVSTDHSSGRCGSSRPTFSNSVSGKTQPTEWSEECMRAYKLMVQSGKLLKSDELVEGVEQKPRDSRPNQSLPTNAVASESNDAKLGDQLEYINPSLVESSE